MEKKTEFIKNEESNQDFYSFDEFQSEFAELKEICEKCTNTNPKKRPKIEQVIDLFYDNVLNKIPYLKNKINLTEITNNFNKTNFFPYWNLFYENNNIEFKNQLEKFYQQETINPNIRKYIQYYSYYLNLYHLYVQCKTKASEFFIKNINKIIHYFKIAANQNNSIFQVSIGTIYLEGKYISRNINKALHYYTIAANNKDLKALKRLGILYLTGKQVTFDINKAMHYFTFAANQNDLEAHYYIGLIYIQKKFPL